MGTIRQIHFVLTEKDDPEMVDHMVQLASAKQLTDEIKTAVTLLAQLRHGNTSLLSELFPDICPPPKPTPPDGDEINRRLTSIDKKIDALAKNNITRITEDAPMVAAPPLKQLSKGIGQGRKVELPTFDDDDGDTMIITKAEAPKMGMLDLVLSLSGDGMLGGKNYSAEANAKSLANRRMT